MKADTLAFLVAGRALEQWLLDRGQLARIRAACAQVPELAVIVAADETDYGDPPRTDRDPLYARVVIGYVAASVQSEYEDDVTADPLPVDPIRVAAAQGRAHALGDLFWARIAAIAPVAPTGSAAQFRASLPAEHRALYADVAYDGTELRSMPDRVFLVPTGPLAGAVLARGEVRTLPVDEDGHVDEDLDRDAWIYHGGNNEQPRRGVFGEQVARVHVEDRGAVALSPEQLAGDVFLLAVYD